MKTFIRKGAVIFFAIAMLISLIFSSDFEDENPIDENKNMLDISGEITWSCDSVPEEDQARYKAFVDAFNEKYPEVTVDVNFSPYGCRYHSSRVGYVLMYPQLDTTTNSYLF